MNSHLVFLNIPSSYYASSLFFITVIILVCLFTPKIGYNGLIKH